MTFSQHTLPLRTAVSDIWATLTGASNGSPQMQNDVSESSIVAVNKPDEAKTRLAILLKLVRDYGVKDTTVVVQEFPLGANIDLRVTFQPTPVFFLLAKNLSQMTERTYSIRTIQSLQDPGIAYIAAEWIGADQSVQTSLQIDQQSGIVIHSYFPHSPVQSSPRRNPPLVLIIEDTKAIGMLMELYLKQAGFKTLLANDGMTGIRMAEEHQPDVITLDVMMPQKDGWEVLKELKATQATAHIPVVIVSVLKDKQIGYQFGASDYLTKPVVQNDFVAIVQRIMRPASPLRTIPPDEDVIHALCAGMDRAAELSTRLSAAPLVHFAPGDMTFLERLLNQARLPDCVVFDLTEEFDKTLACVQRFRLHAGFHSIPAVGIVREEQLPLATLLTSGLLNTLLREEELSLETIRQKFS